VEQTRTAVQGSSSARYRPGSVGHLAIITVGLGEKDVCQCAREMPCRDYLVRPVRGWSGCAKRLRDEGVVYRLINLESDSSKFENAMVLV
jgi:hypothetical protein